MWRISSDIAWLDPSLRPRLGRATMPPPHVVRNKKGAGLFAHYELGTLHQEALRAKSIMEHSGGCDPFCPELLVFAGSHGVARHDVSAYSPEESSRLIHDFCTGKSPGAQIARSNSVSARLIDVGSETPTESVEEGSAMYQERAIKCYIEGWNSARVNVGQPLAVGEIGVANTTISAILAAVLTGKSANTAVGPGSGVTGGRLEKKRSLVSQALRRHRRHATSVGELLLRMGGCEIVALVGAILGAASVARPVFLDGFVTTTAAAVAVAAFPKCRPYLIATHLSREPLHQELLKEMKLSTFMNAGLAVGQGVGAVLGMSTILCIVNYLKDSETSILFRPPRWRGFAKATDTGSSELPQ